MKLKRGERILLLVVVGILAFVWISGGIREGMSGVLPLTQSDIDNNTSAAQQVKSKLTSIVNSLGYTDVNIGNNSLYDILYIMQAYPNSPPSKDDLAKMSGTKLGITTYSQASSIPSLQHTIDVQYQYFNGSSSTPSPASSSSSTQPMTLPVPSPCRPQYKSIPGGTMEFRCYD